MMLRYNCQLWNSRVFSCEEPESTLNVCQISVTEVMLWQEDCVYETLVLPLDERDFEKTVAPIVQEYFEHADTKEVVVSLQKTISCSLNNKSTSRTRTVIPCIQEQLSELNLGPTRTEVPLLAVSLALEAKASQRELTSRLLADLCGTVLTSRDLESAFDKLLWELPDLVLDTPGAPQVNPPESSMSTAGIQVWLWF